MIFECRIEMTNDAFSDTSDVTYSVMDGDDEIPPEDLAAGIELARILRRVADGCDGGGVELGETHPVLDRNGNTVGRWSITEEGSDT